MPAQAAGAPLRVAAVDRAGPPPLGTVLPVVEQRSPPVLVLPPLVRRRQMFVHERDNHLDEVAQAVDPEGHLVVVVRPATRRVPYRADVEPGCDELTRAGVGSSESDREGESTSGVNERALRSDES